MKITTQHAFVKICRAVNWPYTCIYTGNNVMLHPPFPLPHYNQATKVPYTQYSYLHLNSQTTTDSRLCYRYPKHIINHRHACKTPTDDVIAWGWCGGGTIENEKNLDNKKHRIINRRERMKENTAAHKNYNTPASADASPSSSLHSKPHSNISMSNVSFSKRVSCSSLQQWSFGRQ